MFESAISDSFQQLRLEQEVAEGSRVNTDIGAFGLVGARSSHSEVTFLCFAVRGERSGGCRSVSGLDLIVGVVDQLFFGRHLCGVVWGERLVKVLVDAQGCGSKVTIR